MPREKEGYRFNLERLNEVFPDHDLLSVQDVIRFTGRNYRTVKELFPFKGNYISKVELARALC